MWIEAIITHGDLVHALSEILPVKIHLDGEDEPHRWLELHSASDVTLVPNVGVRLTCEAGLQWSLAGISPTVKIEELSILLRPQIVEKKNSGDALAFRIEIEEADIRGIPALIDETIVKGVNAVLATKPLTWDFSSWLTRKIDMGEMFEPLEAAKIDVLWGKTRISDEALVLVVSLAFAFVRLEATRNTPAAIALDDEAREEANHPD